MPWLTKNMFRKSDSKAKSISAPLDGNNNGPHPQNHTIVKTHYTSNPVDIPSDFLKEIPADAQPITVQRVDFANSPLPEHSHRYATVLDNVLSASECKDLLVLAELSSPTGDWAPAMVNAGIGYEVMLTHVRHCDRIVWDEAEIVKRIWDRCIQAEGIHRELGQIQDQPLIQGQMAAEKGDKWCFARVNKRMRFLRYGPGNFFKQHCDGTYETPDKTLRSFYTLHLYLNDSTTHGGDVKGGATTFYSRDMSRRLDVEPKTGRVLIFQHKDLLHSGEEVSEGTKYTMRSDLMYERVLD